MIRILPPLLIMLCSAQAAAAERRYTVTDFDRVQVEGPFQVSLTTGGASSAIATGGNAAIDRLSIDVQGRTLRIRQNRSAWGGYPGEAIGPLRIQLTTHALTGASVSGSGALSIDKVAAMRFDLASSGSGRIGLGSVEADMLTVTLLGSGSVSIAGKAKSFRAIIQGSGSLDAQKLDVQDADVGSDTAGDVKVAVRRSAKVTSTGQGDTHIIGSPSCTIRQTGVGQVYCGKLDQSER